jgi:hypothetical protein
LWTNLFIWDCPPPQKCDSLISHFNMLEYSQHYVISETAQSETGEKLDVIDWFDSSLTTRNAIFIIISRQRCLFTLCLLCECGNNNADLFVDPAPYFQDITEASPGPQVKIISDDYFVTCVLYCVYYTSVIIIIMCVIIWNDSIDGDCVPWVVFIEPMLTDDSIASAAGY